MIPSLNIVAWGTTVPWAEPRQIEQDLIISRAIIALFADPFLAERTSLPWRNRPQQAALPGALTLFGGHRSCPQHKGTHRSDSGSRPRRPFSRGWGRPASNRVPIAPKLVFRVPAEDNPATRIRLKVEINTTEVETCDQLLTVRYSVDNPWFSGEANVVTFSREEMLATKLRALLQRDRGRDLFDIARGLECLRGTLTWHSRRTVPHLPSRPVRPPNHAGRGGTPHVRQIEKGTTLCRM